MRRTTEERVEFKFGIFATGRRAIIESIPKDLSEREFKEQLYYQTCGEPLPEDFFKENDAKVKK